SSVVDRRKAGAAASVRLARLCDREDTRYYEKAEGQRPSHRVLLRLGERGSVPPCRLSRKKADSQALRQGIEKSRPAMATGASPSDRKRPDRSRGAPHPHRDLS